MSRHSRESGIIDRCEECRRFVHDVDDHDCPGDTSTDEKVDMKSSDGEDESKPYR